MITDLMDDNLLQNDLDRRITELKSVEDSIDLLLENKEKITSIVLGFKFDDPKTGKGSVVVNYSGDKDVCYGLAKRVLNATEDELYMEDLE